MLRARSAMQEKKLFVCNILFFNYGLLACFWHKLTFNQLGGFDHSVFDSFVQLTEGRSARDQPKQPPVKREEKVFHLRAFCCTCKSEQAAKLLSVFVFACLCCVCALCFCLCFVFVFDVLVHRFIKTNEKIGIQMRQNVVPLAFRDMLSVALWLKLYRLKSVGANTYFGVVG